MTNTVSSPSRLGADELGPLLPDLLAEPAATLATLVATHGRLVELAAGPLTVLVVAEPEAIREVLVEQQHSFIKGAAVRSTKVLLGEGLLTSEGSEHARQRRLVAPAFHRPQLARFAETMGALAGEEAAAWADHAPGVDAPVVDAHAALTTITMRIVGATLFGVDVTADAAGIAASLDGVLELSNRLLPLAQLMGQGLSPAEEVEAARLMAHLDDVIGGVIAARRADPGAADLVGLLTRAVDTDGDGGGLTDREIRDQAMTLFLAGHETTANALAWTMALLSQHPELAEQIHAEVMRVAADGPVPFDRAGEMSLTRAAIQEAIRLYPPAWITTREVVQQVTIGGVPLPVGAQVVVSPWVTHRDPAWWPEPDEFRVDRWLYPDASRPKWAYFPFGGGSRSCIGEHFALLEATVILAEVVRRWRFEPAGAFPTPEYRVTMRPGGGVPLRLDRRC